MKKLAIYAIALAAAISQGSFAHDLTSDQLAQRSIGRRAVEAVNGGMPAVNHDLMMQEMLTKTAGKVNQFIYWSRPLDWHSQTLPPNPDAIYFMAFFNTREGPVVVEVPPAAAGGSLNANFVDVWQVPLGVKDVPVDGFWSISLCNSEGYFQKNDLGAYSLNNITSKKGADGSVAVQFGGCDGKIPNCLPIMAGWNYTVRLYRPRTEILNGRWKFPEPQPAS